MSNNTQQTIQQLVEDHFQQNEQLMHGERCVAISASHKLHWANQAGIDYQEVESYLQSVCEPVPPENEYQAVPSYRLKS